MSALGRHGRPKGAKRFPQTALSWQDLLFLIAGLGFETGIKTWNTGEAMVGATLWRQDVWLATR